MAQQIAVDGALAQDVRRQVLAWGATPEIESAFRDRKVDLDMMTDVRHGEDASAVVPGLRYRWSAFALAPIASSPRFFSVAGIQDSGEYLVLRGPEEWGALAGTWFARTPEEAKTACLEMFRSVVHETFLPAYSLYDQEPSALKDMDLADRRLLLRRARNRARVRTLERPARWETDVWIIRQNFSVFARRVRCTVPRTQAASPSAFTFRVLYALPLRRSLLM